ncbi:MAG TPA: hypothetical protein ENN46_01540, partial [Candidatus Woesearchaeota archaeon]|nr:hypothetical protein [Candidatus Woesearchaeota archaeon]
MEAKKAFPIVFLMFILAAGIAYAQKGNTCTGQVAIDYYNKGTISGSYQGQEFSFTDYCLGNHLFEFYCTGTQSSSGRTPSVTLMHCSGGCSEGACLGCVPGERKCTEDGRHVISCNQDGTGWNTIGLCEFGCVDGACRESPAECRADSDCSHLICLQGCPAGYYGPKQLCIDGVCVCRCIPYESVCVIGQEKCVDGRLMECSDDGTEWVVKEACRYGCYDARCLECVPEGKAIPTTLDGMHMQCCDGLTLCPPKNQDQVAGILGTCLEKCSEEPVQCTADSDCPQGLVCIDGACEEKQQPPASCKNDADCSSDKYCIGGNCVPKDQEFCYDSDGGKNEFEKGYVEGVRKIQVLWFVSWRRFKDYDRCNIFGNVIERYCEGNKAKSTTIKCEYGCEDGACRTEPKETPQPPPQPPEICKPTIINPCGDKQCGYVFDGCEQHCCGSCPTGQGCVNNQCKTNVCTCFVWVRTSNNCADGYEPKCTGFSSCVCQEPCVPDCDGKECGDDGCGGSCGPCQIGQVCKDYKCVEHECIPKELACSEELGVQCGIVDDGCDGEYDCGRCPGRKVCVNNWCVDPQVNTSCSHAGDCYPIPYCINNKCAYCAVDNHCASGEVCREGYCVEPEPDDNPCVTDCEWGCQHYS